MDKHNAIRAVNEHLGHEQLTPHNTSWSTMHAEQGSWWLNIRSQKFEEDLHLCLEIPRGFIWLHIPPNGLHADDFQAKSQTDARRNIEIRCNEDEPDYMTDRRSGSQFAQYTQHDFVI